MTVEYDISAASAMMGRTERRDRPWDYRFFAQATRPGWKTDVSLSRHESGLRASGSISPAVRARLAAGIEELGEMLRALCVETEALLGRPVTGASATYKGSLTIGLTHVCRDYHGVYAAIDASASDGYRPTVRFWRPGDDCGRPPIDPAAIAPLVGRAGPVIVGALPNGRIGA